MHNICPFCNIGFHLDNNTIRIHQISFEYSNFQEAYELYGSSISSTDISIEIYDCPTCYKSFVIAKLNGSKFPNKEEIFIYPKSEAKIYPDYIPLQIRNDYRESVEILRLSPKSSATLSRRCIQGMIRDKYNVKCKNLYDEIDAIKDKIEPSIYNAIHSLRKLGNIGAHMEKDVNLIIEIEPNEAEKLTKLVELLIKEWYIIPYERTLLLEEICQISISKQNQIKDSFSNL